MDGLNLYAAYFDVNGIDPYGLNDYDDLKIQMLNTQKRFHGVIRAMAEFGGLLESDEATDALLEAQYDAALQEYDKYLNQMNATQAMASDFIGSQWYFSARDSALIADIAEFQTIEALGGWYSEDLLSESSVIFNDWISASDTLATHTDILYYSGKTVEYTGTAASLALGGGALYTAGKQAFIKGGATAVVKFGAKQIAAQAASQAAISGLNYVAEDLDLGPEFRLGLAGLQAFAMSRSLMKGSASGGRWGNSQTRNQNYKVANELENRGWKITNIGKAGYKEEYIPGPGGGRKGAAYPDITAVKNGKTLRVNTVDTLNDNVTMTSREAANALKIRRLTGGHLLTIPKRKR